MCLNRTVTFALPEFAYRFALDPLLTDECLDNFLISIFFIRQLSFVC